MIHPSFRHHTAAHDDLSFAPMDLSGVEILHPQFDEELRLLTLELDHGKANEMGTAQLDAFVALCELVESANEITCVCTSSRVNSNSSCPGPTIRKVLSMDS